MENTSKIFWKDIIKLSQYLEQFEIFKTTGKIIPLNPDSASGDLVRFGTYSWIVLNKDDDEGTYFLLASRLLAINPMRYHRENTEITWENSTIREYLNTTFYGKFCNEDKERIIETTLKNPTTPWFDTPGGNETSDKIFLLNLDELVKYLGDSAQLSKKSWPRENIDLTKPCLISDEYDTLHSAINEFGEQFRYWLRSPGREQNYAAIVREDGTIDLGGEAVNTTAGVRPAMWVKL